MTKALRQKVYDKYNGHCAYCGRKIAYKCMQVDHLMPQCLSHLYDNEKVRKHLGMNGSHINSFSNLMPSCRRCNHYKRGGRLEEFRRSMKTLHERIIKIYIAKVALDYGIVKLEPWNGIFYFETIIKS